MTVETGPGEVCTSCSPCTVHLDPQTDAWLLVWVSPGDRRSEVNRAVKQVRAQSPNAHTILSREIEGERWSLLLVHYSKAECDTIVGILRETWTYGFVNAVLDLADLKDS